MQAVNRFRLISDDCEPRTGVRCKPMTDTSQKEAWRLGVPPIFEGVRHRMRSIRSSWGRGSARN